MDRACQTLKYDWSEPLFGRSPVLHTELMLVLPRACVLDSNSPPPASAAEDEPAPAAGEAPAAAAEDEPAPAAGEAPAAAAEDEPAPVPPAAPAEAPARRA